MRIKLKSYLSIFTCMLAVAVLFSSCGPSDMEIQTEVRKIVIYENPQVEVRVSNGVVNLTGSVRTEAEKTKLEAAVAEIKGVDGVNSTIEIIAYKTQGDKDNELKAGIVEALKAVELEKVGVEVDKGKITLSGKATIDQQKKVMEILKQFETKVVVNDMVE